MLNFFRCIALYFLILILPAAHAETVQNPYIHPNIEALEGKSHPEFGEAYRPLFGEDWTIQDGDSTLVRRLYYPLLVSTSLILALYGSDFDLYFLARDGESLYDIAIHFSKSYPHWINRDRIHLIPISRAVTDQIEIALSESKPHSDESYTPAQIEAAKEYKKRVLKYLSQEGISEGSLLNQKRVLLVDSGKIGTIHKRIRSLFPTFSDQISGHLLTSWASHRNPTTRVFQSLFRGNPNEVINLFENVLPKYSPKVDDFIETKGRVVPISSLQFEESRRQRAIRYMEDLKYFLETREAQKTFEDLMHYWLSAKNLLKSGQTKAFMNHLILSGSNFPISLPGESIPHSIQNELPLSALYDIMNAMWVNFPPEAWAGKLPEPETLAKIDWDLDGENSSDEDSSKRLGFTPEELDVQALKKIYWTHPDLEPVLNPLAVSLTRKPRLRELIQKNDLPKVKNIFWLAGHISKVFELSIETFETLLKEGDPNVRNHLFDLLLGLFQESPRHENVAHKSLYWDSLYHLIAKFPAEQRSYLYQRFIESSPRTLAPHWKGSLTIEAFEAFARTLIDARSAFLEENGQTLVFRDDHPVLLSLRKMIQTFSSRLSSDEKFRLYRSDVFTRIPSDSFFSEKERTQFHQVFQETVAKAFQANPLPARFDTKRKRSDSEESARPNKKQKNHF